MRRARPSTLSATLISEATDDTSAAVFPTGQRRVRVFIHLVNSLYHGCSARVTVNRISSIHTFPVPTESRDKTDDELSDIAETYSAVRASIYNGIKVAERNHHSLPCLPNAAYLHRLIGRRGTEVI